MLTVQRVREVAATVLPRQASVGGDAQVVRGEFHDVLLLPDHAVVKVARGRAVEDLNRRAGLVGALARAGLPFAVPTPLGPVATFEDCSAVALSWVPGHPATTGSVRAARLRELLEALAGVDVTPSGSIARWLGVPHAYAGGPRWAALMSQVVDLLPPAVRATAVDRVDAVAHLPAVPASLVHGDLAGDNIRWNEDGSLAGVIDWDLAAAWDPGVDVACLAWFGWPTVAAAVDAPTYQRARTWAATFHLESVAAAIDNGEDQGVIDQRVRAAAHQLSAPAGS